MNRILATVGAVAITALVVLKLFEHDSVNLAINEIAQFATIAAVACFAVPILIVVIGAALVGGMYWKKQANNHLRRRDGAFALQKIQMSNGRVALVDMNEATGPVVIVDKRRSVVEEPEPGPGWQIQAIIKALTERTRQAQAMYPGDQVRNAGSKAPTITAAGGRFLGGGYDRQPQLPEPVDNGEWRMVDDTPSIRDAQTAIQMSEQQGWIVGQSDTGQIARFNPALQAHIGVIGDTGTGKTTSVGFALAAQALRHGWHTVIIDPDGGEDWAPFRHHAEWHEADRETFPGLIDRIHALYEQRTDGQQHKPVFVVIEEYGDLINQLRLVDRTEANRVDAQLDSILRRGRKRKISLCFIDQYPEHWSQQTISGTKAKAVFHLGPNQGAKVQEYHANSLPDRGTFLWKREEYQTWDTKPHLRTVLAEVPALNGFRVVDSPVRSSFATERPANASTSGANAPNGTEQGGDTPLPAPPFDVRSHPKRDVIQWWRKHLPNGTQADFRRWADDNGVEVSRGYVSDVFNGLGDDDPPGDDVDVWTLNGIARPDTMYINGERVSGTPPYTEVT